MPIEVPQSPEIRLLFPSGEMSVRIALGSLMDGVVRFDLSDDLMSTIELVLGEVLNNIVEHAYGPDLSGMIELLCENKEEEIHFRITDDGRPLPGLVLPPKREPELDCEIDDLPEGGFGWFMVHSLAQELCYKRLSGQNVLSFCFPKGSVEI